MPLILMKQCIHGLEDIRYIIRDVILNGDIILRDITLSEIQFYLVHTALKKLLPICPLLPN